MPKLLDPSAFGAKLTPSTQRGIDRVRNAGVVQRAEEQAANQMASSIGRAGNQVSGALEEIAQDEADREFKRLDTEFAKEVQKITYGDGTPANPGFYGLRGENALKAHADATKAIEAARARLSEGASGLALRKFEQAADIRVTRETGIINRHLVAQREAANDAVSAAAIAQARDDATVGATDPTVIGQSLQLVTDEMVEAGRRKGLPASVVQQQIEAEHTKIHLGVIDRLMELDPMQAQSYYDTNKGSIDGTARADVEKALESGVLRKQSQTASDQIYNLGLPEKDAMKRARDISDPKLRDETVARLQRRYSEDDRITREEDRDRKKNAWSHVIGGGSVDDLPPQSLSLLDGTTISAMRTFEGKRAKNGRGFADASDPTAYNRLHNLFMEDKVAFAEYDITSEINNLDEGDYQYWLSQQRSVDKSAEKAANKEASYVLADRVAKEYMNAAGIEYGASAERSDAQRAQRVFSLIRSTVDEFHAEGKKPTLQDVEARLDELFLTGDPPGRFNDGTPFHEVIGTEDEAGFVLSDIDDQRGRIAKVAGVPAESVDAIVDALEDAGLPVTVDNIRENYERAVSSSGRNR